MIPRCPAAPLEVNNCARKILHAGKGFARAAAPSKLVIPELGMAPLGNSGYSWHSSLKETDR